VQFLETITPDTQKHASYFEVRDAILSVESITQDVFGTSSERIEHEDAEIAGEYLFEITVRCSGDVDSIVKKQLQWHAKLAELPLKTRRLFHLSVEPID
jgi:hypothetical protein